MLLVSLYIKQNVKGAPTNDVVARDYSREAELCLVSRPCFWAIWHLAITSCKCFGA